MVHNMIQMYDTEELYNSRHRVEYDEAPILWFLLRSDRDNWMCALRQYEYSTLLNNKVQYSTVLYSILQYSTIQ